MIVPETDSLRNKNAFLQAEVDSYKEMEKTGDGSSYRKMGKVGAESSSLKSRIVELENEVKRLEIISDAYTQYYKDVTFQRTLRERPSIT